MFSPIIIFLTGLLCTELVQSNTSTPLSSTLFNYQHHSIEKRAVKKKPFQMRSIIMFEYNQLIKSNKVLFTNKLSLGGSKGNLTFLEKHDYLKKYFFLTKY